MSDHIDHVKFGLSAAPGTGPLAVSGPAPGEPVVTLGPGDDGKHLPISITDGAAWETADDCVYDHGARSLSRGTLVASSTGARVSFGANAVVSVVLHAAFARRAERAVQPEEVLGLLAELIEPGPGLSVAVVDGRLRIGQVGTGTGSPPQITAAPVVLGLPTEGQPVAWSSAEASGDPAPTVTHFIELGGVLATSPSTSGGYTAPAGSAGQTLRVAARASNGAGPDSALSFSQPVVVRAAAQPVTAQFTGSQMRSGLVGPVSETLEPGVLRLRALRSVWVGSITGASAVLQASGVTPATGAIEVSVDGGAFAAAPNNGNAYTLFAGLADEPHQVRWRFFAGAGSAGKIALASNVLAVTGVAPALAAAQHIAQAGDGVTLTASALVAQTAGFLPALAPRHTGATYGGNPASIAIRGDFTRLTLVGMARFMFVSRDGAAPTVIDTVNTANTSRVAELLVAPGEATYYCWDGGLNASDLPSLFAVVADAPIAVPSSVGRLHHFGHSIIFGVGASSRGHTDIMRISGPRVGRVTGQFGVSGNTIANLETRMPAVLAAMDVDSDDIALLDIGQNDGPGEALSTDEATRYGNLISMLLAKGYGGVRCLAVYNGAGNNPAPINSSIQSLVSARNDSRVSYVARNGYVAATSGGTIDAPDGLHPSDAGYLQMAALNQSAVEPSLGPVGGIYISRNYISANYIR